MRKSYVTVNLIVILILCCSLVLALLYFSRGTNSSGNGNGFNRKFPPHAVRYNRGLNLQFNSYYIAGIHDGVIYLGNYTAPLKILKVNTTSMDSTVQILAVPEKTRLTKAAKLTVIFPYFYLSDGVTRALIIGRIDKSLPSTQLRNVNFSTIATPLNQNSTILRSTWSKSSNYVLVKQTQNPQKSVIHSNLLHKQIDGQFCVDGNLEYDPVTQKLVYLYYYRNQFISMDTNLNVLYYGRTIDTNTLAKVKTTRISPTKVTVSAPPHVVNKSFSLSSNNLFIHSNLRSNIETEQLFESGSVIDVYDVKNQGSYRFSFYVFPHVRNKMTSFTVHKNNLFAIQEKYLVKYTLSSTLFTQNSGEAQ